MRLPLQNGLFTLIDDADYPLVQNYGWYASRARNGWYVKACLYDPKTQITYGTVYLHRLLMNAPRSRKVDHQDGDGLNNQRYNLRFATNSQNLQNRRKCSGTSRYKGVSRSVDSWVAHIRAEGKSRYLGRYRLEEEAARAYDAAARRYFGEFARTNFEEGIGAT